MGKTGTVLRAIIRIFSPLVSGYFLLQWWNMKRLVFLLPKNKLLAAGILIVFFALLFRLPLIPNPGFEADISFWKSWGLAAIDGGIPWSMHNTNNNYPTPFTYVLWIMARVYSVAADPHNFYTFWNNMNAWFLTVAKTPAILADFGIAAIMLWFGKNAKRIGFPQFPLWVYMGIGALYLLNPISVIDGAWWGQVDSVGVFVFLLALMALLTKRPFLAGIIYMASMMTKLQNMIYGPVFFLFVWQQMGFAGFIRAISGAVLAFFGLNIEFFLSRDMHTVLASLTQNYDYFPLMSLNAFNPWWIVAKANGMHVSDKLLTIGIINAKTMGLMLFSCAYLFAVLLLVTDTIGSMMKRTVKNAADTIGQHPVIQQSVSLFLFWSALIVSAGAFFLFQTESHDRYAFPISVFLLLWGLFYVYLEKPKDTVHILGRRRTKLFLLFYGLFSLFYFYNLHTALVFNYPKNGLPLLSGMSQPFITMSVAAVLTVLYGIFLAAIRREAKPIVYGIPLVVFVCMFAAKNMPLLTKKPVDLSSLTPHIAQQSYGTRVNDMPTNASMGTKSWSFLSVQYSFYRKGVGTHASSFIEYDINRQFRRFSTDMGIDTEAGGQGSVVFLIYGDDKLLYTSPKVGRYDMPVHAEVSVRGVKRLGLVVTDGGNGINDDHADWLNPKLWP